MCFLNTTKLTNSVVALLESLHVHISFVSDAERVAAGRVRAIAWLKDAVDDYRHWERMQEQTEASQKQHQQQHLDRQPTDMRHQQPDATLAPSSSGLPYPLTPKKLETLKSVSVENSSVGADDTSISDISSMHPPPPHSLSRINDAEVSNQSRSSSSNPKSSALHTHPKFESDSLFQMLLKLHEVVSAVADGTRAPLSPAESGQMSGGGTAEKCCLL